MPAPERIERRRQEPGRAVDRAARTGGADAQVQAPHKEGCRGRGEGTPLEELSGKPGCPGRSKDGPCWPCQEPCDGHPSAVHEVKGEKFHVEVNIHVLHKE